MLEQLRQNVLGGTDGNGETDSLGRGDDGGVDADHPAASVDEGAAAVAWIQGGVGLNDVVDQVSSDAAQRSAQRADDAGRDRGIEAIGTADGDDQLSDAQIGRVAEGRIGQRRSLGLHHGQVGPGIGADEPARNLPAIVSRTRIRRARAPRGGW